MLLPLTYENHPALPLLIAVIGGYLSGSVPYGLILSRLAGVADIRKQGSGNIGATNVLRVAGKKIAALTLLLDALKGFVPVAVAKQFHIDYAALAALGAFLGHLFPVWLKFRGGKGVATGLGICFAFSWIVGAIVAAVWLLVALLSRYSSLSALVAFGLAPLIALRVTQEPRVAGVTLLIALLVWARHRENIRRLARGAESKISLGRKDKPA